MDPELMATIDAKKFDDGEYDPDGNGYIDENGVYHWQCETCGEWDGNCFGPWDDESPGDPDKPSNEWMGMAPFETNRPL